MQEKESNERGRAGEAAQKEEGTPEGNRGEVTAEEKGSGKTDRDVSDLLQERSGSGTQML